VRTWLSTIVRRAAAKSSIGIQACAREASSSPGFLAQGRRKGKAPRRCRPHCRFNQAPV
jgi:hypothetical protein